MRACVRACFTHGDKTIVLPPARGSDSAGCVRAPRSLKQKGERVGDPGPGDDQPVPLSLYVRRVAHALQCMRLWPVACGRRAGAGISSDMPAYT